MTTIKQIQDTIEFLEGKITAATDDTDAKTSYEESLKLAQATLQKCLKDTYEEKKPVLATTTNETYSRSLNIKSIENALNDVPTFKGIDAKETTQYIERLEKIFTIMVKEVDPNLEADYLKLVKVRLSDQVYKNMSTTNEDVSSFDKYKSWIKKQYAGRLNAFQLLQRAFNVEFRPREQKFTVYSQTVSEEIRTALTAIREQYKKNTDQDLGVESLAEFFSAQILAENLRQYCWPLYSQMVNDMEKLSTSAEVAQKAEFYRERLGGTFTGSQGDSLWSRQGWNQEDKKQNNGPKPYPKRNSNVKSNSDSKENGDWSPNQGWKSAKSWKTTPESQTHSKQSGQNPQRSDQNDGTRMQKRPKKQTTKKNSMHTSSIIDLTTENATSPSPSKSVFTPTSPFQ